MERASVPTLSVTWRALVTVTEELMSDRRSLADTQAAEREARITTYENSRASSDAARSKEADAASFGYWRDVVKLKAEIQAKEDFRTILILAIEHDVTIT